MDVEKYSGSNFFGSKGLHQQDLPQARSKGFAALTDEFMEPGLDLNEQLIRNKAATFFFKMKSDAMKDAGIFDGDILLVDRSVKLTNGKIIVAILNGEMLVRRFHKNFSSAFLIPENDRYKTINMGEFTDLNLWGVVVSVIRNLH